MTEQAQAAAETPAAPQAIPMSEGLARYRASKDAAKATETNPVSEAARTMGQRAAEARRERQAEASQTQGASQEEEQQDHVEDDPLANTGETLNETADGEPPVETEAETEGESAPQTIDLGDGVKVTLDEVRDGFMMKADHTRKTQALADDRKSFETARTQKLTVLDNALASLKSHIPQPKDLATFVREKGADEGLIAFSEQNERLQSLVTAFQAAESERESGRVEMEAARDKDLAENYNKDWATPAKRTEAYTKLSAHALSLGAQPEQLRGLPAFVLKALDGDAKHTAIQANKGNVTKLIADKPRVAKPGAKVSAQASQQTNVQAGFSRLKQSGKLSDAVSLLRTMRGPKRG